MHKTFYWRHSRISMLEPNSSPYLCCCVFLSFSFVFLFTHIVMCIWLNKHTNIVVCKNRMFCELCCLSNNRLCFTAEIRLASWTVTFTVNYTTAKVVLSCLFHYFIALYAFTHFHVVPRSWMVELCLHSPIRLQFVVLNELRTRTTLPFPIQDLLL
jgi:hypothetical protein